MYHKSTWEEYNYYHEKMFPTQEDVLDTNFRAIVSDLRGLISGTLAPRTWADISSSWRSKLEDLPTTKKVRESRASIKERRSHERIPTTRPKRGLASKKRYRIRRMTQLLVKNGMEAMEAYITACKLLEQK